jgi:hypothetical protein
MDLEIQDEKAANLCLQANKRNQRCNLGLQYENPKIAAGKQYHLQVLLRHVQEVIIKW